VALRATAVSFDQIDVTWTNASTITTEFSLEERGPGGTFAPIPEYPGTGTTFHHRGLVEGTTHEYQVFAVIHDGVEDDAPQPVLKSAASATASATTLVFTTAFTGTLTTDAAGFEGFCVVQRLSTTLLTAGGTQVRILLRGSTTGDLTLDKVTISQAATGQGVELYDPGPDLTVVVPSAAFPSGVTIAQNTAPVTVGPVNYTLDITKDLLVAFDISNTQGNLRVGALTGGDTYSSPATAEAGAQPRTAGYQASPPGNLCLVEKIEVL
jgi:hypothetical protein